MKCVPKASPSWNQYNRSKIQWYTSGICITCRALGYECYRLLQIYSRAFFSNSFIYSQPPYNILNSRFEIKFWVQIDTKSFVWYMFEWRSWEIFSLITPRSQIRTLWLHFQHSINFFSTFSIIRFHTAFAFVWRHEQSIIFLFHTALITHLNGRCKSRQARQTHGISLNNRPICSILLLDFQSITEWFLKMCVSNWITLRDKFLVKKPWRTQRRVCVFVCVFTCVIS
jgi:hypothetical protein